MVLSVFQQTANQLQGSSRQIRQHFDQVIKKSINGEEQMDSAPVQMWYAEKDSSPTGYSD